MEATGSSFPDLRGMSEAGMTNAWPASVARRIPQCFRTHRAMAPLVASCPDLFEERRTHIEDNVMQWWPADKRPPWVGAWQYQKRQLLRDREQTAKARHAELVSKPDMEMSKTSPEAIWTQMLRPPAGSRVPQGAFPNSFGYSNGLVLEDPYYDRLLAPQLRTAPGSSYTSTMFPKHKPLGPSLTQSSWGGMTR